MKPDKLILFVFGAIGLTLGLIVVCFADFDFLNPFWVEGREYLTPEGKRAEMRFLVLGFSVYSRMGTSLDEFSMDENLATGLRYTGLGWSDWCSVRVWVSRSLPSSIEIAGTSKVERQMICWRL